MREKEDDAPIDQMGHALGLDKSNPPSLRDDQRNWADEMGHFLHLDREAEPG